MRKVLITYTKIFVLFTVLFLISFHLPIPLRHNILFYRGLITLTVLAIFFFAVIYIFHLKRKINNIDIKISAVLVAVATNLCFFIVFPVTLDRSITVFILKNLYQQEDKTLDKKVLENNLINIYVIEQNALEKRIEEQKIIGTIATDGSNLKLTKKMDNFITFSKLINIIYAIDNKDFNHN